VEDDYVKITCVLGSPRRTGNSASIVARFVETAEGLGATTETFVLNELTFRGCQACMACKGKANRCVVKDDMTTVLDSLVNADVVVAATPVYGAHVSGQFKCFMDRCYSFLKPDYRTNRNPSRIVPGKQAVLIMTQGNPDPTLYNDLADRLQRWMERYIRPADVRIVKGYGLLPNGGPHEPFLREADEIARSICDQSARR
jgi:multimeric flavodoxin WrbA